LWRVFADPAQVESMLINLVVNARNSMAGGGKLTIETGNADLDERHARAHAEVTPGQYTMISVTDTGIGMTPEVMGQAFDPFFTTKPPGKGTGLGLSQVLGFVKQSNGHVKIYSEVGRGTTVKVYLPRFTGEGPMAVTVDEGARPQSGRREELILVVEDDEGVRNLSVEALRELGYSVIHTASGAARDRAPAGDHAAVHRHRHAGDDRPRARREGFGAAPRTESPLHDRLHAQRRGA
jgi:CheY-like chemotaxis protein